MCTDTRINWGKAIFRGNGGNWRTSFWRSTYDYRSLSFCQPVFKSRKNGYCKRVILHSVPQNLFETCPIPSLDAYDPHGRPGRSQRIVSGLWNCVWDDIGYIWVEIPARQSGRCVLWDIDWNSGRIEKEWIYRRMGLPACQTVWIAGKTGRLYCRVWGSDAVVR